MSKHLVVTGVVALIVGFGVGYLIPHSTAATTASGGFAGRSGTFTRGGASANGGNGFLSGTVAKKDSGSITVNMRDGTSRVVLLTPATTVSKSVTGTLQDVGVGSNVIVNGTTNSDGSVSATLIQVRPADAAAPGTP